MKKVQITTIAKKVCRINEALLDACSLAEELCHNEDLRSILDGNDPDAMLELKAKIKKLCSIEEAADMRECAANLEEASDILQELYYEE